jgi:predicted MFS family arabinose efflux permease
MNEPAHVLPPYPAESVPFPRAFIATLLLALINVFNYMDRMVFAAVVQPLKQELGLTDPQIGFLTGFAFIALYAAIMFPLARWADRVGRRRVLGGSIAAWSVATTCSGLVHDFPQLAVARACVGVGEAGCMPSTHALLSELYPPTRRALPVAIVAAGSAVGTGLGLGLGGLIAGGHGWRYAFLFLGPPGILLALVVFLALPEPARTSLPTAAQRPLGESIAALLRVPTYRSLLYALPFYQFAAAGVIGWLPTFFTRSHGMSVQKVGPLFGIAYGVGLAVGGIVGAQALQVLTRRTPERMLHLCAYLISAAAVTFFGALFVRDTWLALALFMLFGALAGAVSSPIVACQQSVVHERMRAQAAALALVVSAYIGLGLGPLLVGWGSQVLTPRLGPDALRAALLVASSAALFAGFFLWRASRTYTADVLT